MTLLAPVKLRERVQPIVLPGRGACWNPANPFSQLTIESLIQQHRFLPDRTGILGICEDGLPVLVDWMDPRPGSFLVGGSNLEGISRLLQLAAISTLARTPAADLELLVLSHQPDQWAHFRNFPGSPDITILPIYEREAGESILRCSRRLDQRLNGRGQCPLLLVIVDDLKYLNRLDFDVQINFQWFAKQGPECLMWTLAGIDASQAQNCDHFLASFQTRILGQTSDPFQADWLANAHAPDTGKFHRTQQFSARIRQHWTNFWLPGQA